MTNSVLLSKTPGGSSSIWLSSKSLNRGSVSLIKVERFKPFLVVVYSSPLPSPPPHPPFQNKGRADMLTIFLWNRASDVEQTVNVFLYIQCG